jgi:shikimate dehydrogenase
MKKYALIGEKLSHSHSPLLHSEIFKDLNIDATYELLEVKEDELSKVIDNLKKGIYSGYNVTIPYKKVIMKYLDVITDEAKAIGAVNTISYKDGKVIGYNTDYYGFKETVINNNIDVLNKDCYILGTGGASLAVEHVILDLGGKVIKVSRNPFKSLKSLIHFLP